MITNPDAKRILCYGDSNTWGWVPGRMGSERFPVDKRWPGILQDNLGTSYEIIEEGLGARTTKFNDSRPELPLRNGLESLPAILETNLPLDLVIIMLGTTDTKEMFDESPVNISGGLRSLIKVINEYKVLEGSVAPKILVIVPPVVDEETEFAAKLFKGGTSKGKELGQLYAAIADDEKCLFLDPSEEVKVDVNEGVHLGESAHQKLAELIFGKIKELDL